MATLPVILLAVVALLAGSIRPDSPAARPASRMLADLRATQWWRIAGAVICIVGGGPFVVLLSTARAALYGLGVAVATACCWAATRSSLSHRPIRVRLEFCA